MGVPPIQPYPMPVELPDNTMSWTLRPERAVLLVHDMQQYFLDFFPSGRPPVTELVANVARLRSAAVAAGMPVVYTAQPGGMTRGERGLLHDVWGPGMDSDPEHRRIVPEVAPRHDDLVLTKWRYSAFTRSPLERYLREHDRDQLVVCGVYAHVGCLVTATDAFSRDIEAFLVADAVADFSAEYHRMALRYAAERCAMTMSCTAAVERMAALDLVHDR